MPMNGISVKQSANAAGYRLQSIRFKEPRSLPSNARKFFKIICCAVTDLSAVGAPGFFSPPPVRWAARDYLTRLLVLDPTDEGLPVAAVEGQDRPPPVLGVADGDELWQVGDNFHAGAVLTAVAALAPLGAG